jgi:hypothetical protein
MKDKTWECCPCDDNQDVAFVYYDYCPTDERVELACGGFSLRATRLLTESLEHIGQELWPANYITPNRHVGLFLVKFSIEPSGDTTEISNRKSAVYQTEVIPIPDVAIRRRLQDSAETNTETPLKRRTQKARPR